MQTAGRQLQISPTILQLHTFSEQLGVIANITDELPFSFNLQIK